MKIFWFVGLMKITNIVHTISLASLLLIVITCDDSPRINDNENEVLFSSDSTYIYIGDKHFVADYEPLYPDGEINAVIEIPAGTSTKWEVDKSDGGMKLEFKEGEPKIINYLGYPGNYGMIPGTLLSKLQGGDGDPLDVIVLGPPVKRGDVVKCKLIGVLKMLDYDEHDDKLIAVLPNTAFYDVDDLDELNEEFNGVLEIIQLWFANYKGQDIIEIKGFGDEIRARQILESAIKTYKLFNNE